MLGVLLPPLRGDKGVEMELIPIYDYIQAVARLVERHPESFDTGAPINLFLTTEDPYAEQEFRAAAESRHWRVFVYTAAVLSSTESVGKPLHAAARHNGASGRHSLVSLFLALEADYYVLTIGSNWSRLIDEIRLGVIERQCSYQWHRFGAVEAGGSTRRTCTDMIALNRRAPKKSKKGRLMRPQSQGAFSNGSVELPNITSRFQH